MKRVRLLNRSGFSVPVCYCIALRWLRCLRIGIRGLDESFRSWVLSPFGNGSTIGWHDFVHTACSQESMCLGLLA